MCKYSRDERKKLHKKIFAGVTFPRTFTDWNKDFTSINCSEQQQDGIWERYFPKKVVLPPTSNYWPYTFVWNSAERGHSLHNVNVLHIPTGKQISGMAVKGVNGGGPEFDLWHDLSVWIDEYTRSQIFLKNEWCKKNDDSLDCCYAPIPVTLNDSWGPAPLPVWKTSYVVPQETTMNRYEAQCNSAYANAQVAAPISQITEERNYLLERLSNIRYEKEGEELRRAFGLEDDEAPKTIKERKERFAAGKYIIQWRADEEDYEDEDEEIGSYMAGGKIRWRDPAVKEDRKGYNLAVDKIEKDLKKVKDTIKIKSSDEGLKALEKFETTTYH